MSAFPGTYELREALFRLRYMHLTPYVFNTILLVGGDKSGGSEKRFYRQLIKKADARFDEHVTRMETERRKSDG